VSPSRTKAALGAAFVFAIAPSAIAQAASKTVYMGAPPASQKAFAALGSDVNAFFPSTITVHRGDKVKFFPVGFHSVELPGKGEAAAPLVSPGAPIAGKNDALGVPFWFNGQPELQLTPSLLNLNYGRTFSYSGASEVLSGLAVGSKPMTVKFPKAGTFTYFCNIHSGMKGKVRVVSGKAPSAKSDAKTVKKQVTAALKEARTLQTTLLPKDTIQLGNGGKTGVEVLAMFPGAMTVPVGTTLTFEMSRLTYAAHTATTGPGDPGTEPNSFLGKLSGSINQPPFDQAGVYPSDPRGVPALLTPSLHGNGFWSSGFMDNAGATPQPKRSQVKIVAPGTYNFFCLLHPFMKVAVTAV
jgi:plastocyanin